MGVSDVAYALDAARYSISMVCWSSAFVLILFGYFGLRALQHFLNPLRPERVYRGLAHDEDSSVHDVAQTTATVGVLDAAISPEALRGRRLAVEQALRVRPMRGQQKRMVAPLAEGVAIAQGLSGPTALHVIDSSSVNGAVWLDEKAGRHVAITEGATRHLDKQCLEAMVAQLLARSPALGLRSPSNPWSAATATSYDEWDAAERLAQEVTPFLRDVLTQARDADAKATLATRDSEAMLRVLAQVRDVGGRVPWIYPEQVHPQHFFAWPFYEEQASELLDRRTEYLESLIEVRSRQESDATRC